MEIGGSHMPSKTAMRSWWITNIIIEEKLTMSAMYKPPHPGEILADTVLRADGGISVTEFAKKLKMTRAAVSRVVNGKAGISPELSLRLEEALGSSAAAWLAVPA